MSNYRKGRAREYYVKKLLLQKGALWVVRSYGSHGLFDLTAVFPSETWLVQVKKKYIHPKELFALQDFKKKLLAENIKIVLYINREFRFLGDGHVQA